MNNFRRIKNKKCGSRSTVVVHAGVNAHTKFQTPSTLRTEVLSRVPTKISLTFPGFP